MSIKQSFFQARYLSQKPTLAEALGVTNPHQIPKLNSITLHARYGQYLTNSQKKRFVIQALSMIAGSKAREIQARRSVSQFKIRKGMTCGCAVTLRRDAMYEFLGRLYIALPRMRSFNGFSKKSFDGMGNFNFGIEDHTAFIEVENMIEHRFGFDVCITTTATNDQYALRLIQSLDFPFL